MPCSGKRGDSVLKSICDLCGKKPGPQSDKIALRNLQNTQVFVRAMSSETATCPDDGSKFTQYVFRCCAMIEKEEMSWEVRRRFSDFHRLHMHLKKKGEVTADFPSKNPFGMVGLVVKNREVALMDYLNSVLNRCNDDQCLLLTKFLRVNKHLQQHSDRNGCSEVKKCSADDDRQRHNSMQIGGHGESFTGSNRLIAATVPSSSLRSRSHGESSAEFSRILENELVVIPYSSSEDDNEYERVRTSLHRPKLSHISESVPSGNEAECMFCDEEGDGGHPNQNSDSSAATLSKAEILEKQKAFLHELKQRQQSKSKAHTPIAHTPEELEDAANAAVAGVGLVFVHIDHPSQRGAVMVDEILSNTAAEAEGSVEVGDLLLSVDGVLVKGLDLLGVRRMIVGPVGSAVTLEFQRSHCYFSGSRSFSVTLHRGVSADGTRAKAKTAPSCADFQQEAASPKPDEEDNLVQAIYGFAAQRGHELNLCPGDLVVVTRRHRSGWWEGQALHSGVAGWFPSNHVRPATAQISAGGRSPVCGLDSSCPESDCDSGHYGGRGKALSTESSGSAQSLSLRSTVHGSLSADSAGSSSEATPRPPDVRKVLREPLLCGGASDSREKVSSVGGGAIEEVCSWLRTVDVRGALDASRSRLAQGDAVVARIMNMR